MSGPVSTGLGDHLWRTYHLGILTLSHLGQLSLLPLVEQEMNSQRAVMLCDQEVKTGAWLIPLVDKRDGGTWNCAIPHTCHTWAN